MRNYTRIALAGALAVTAGTASITLALMVPSSGADAGMVTDPEQGIELPASKEADIQELEGPADPAADVVGTDDVSDDTTAPSSVAASITSDTDANGDLAAPIPNDILANPTNNYSSGDSTSSTAVYAGASGQDPTRGAGTD